MKSLEWKRRELTKPSGKVDWCLSSGVPVCRRCSCAVLAVLLVSSDAVSVAHFGGVLLWLRLMTGSI